MKVFERLDAEQAFSEEEKLLLEGLRTVCRDTIGPNAAEVDETGDFPWENVKALNGLELNRIFIPEKYGGAQLSYPAYLECVREISKVCASTGVIWATNFHAMSPVLDRGGDELKARVLPQMAEGALAALCITEPTAGSDATGMKTVFRPEGDEIVVNGGKTFITNGDVADFYLLFGKWSERGDGKEAISVLVLEKGAEGFSALARENKMGMRGSSTTGLAFDNVRVPRANLLGEPGGGLNLLFSALNKSRPSVAAHALGIARAAFEDAVAYINQRRQSGRRIVEFQGIQFLLADLATELAMCEAWLWRVGRMIERGESDVNVEASMLKMRASDLAMRMATEAVQLHGGYGYIKEYRVERLMRDAKICQIWEGTNQIHRQLIGRSFVER